jgi:hypothetical protein
MPVPAGAAIGHRLLVLIRSTQAVTSMTDNQSTSYAALTIPSKGADDYVLISAPLTAVPTTITGTLASEAFLGKAEVFVLAGASGTVSNHGTISTGFSTDPRSHAYTTLTANEFAFGQIDFTGGGVTGAGSADGDHTWLLSGGGYQHTFGTVRPSSGSYGATLGPVGAGSPSSGYWFSLEDA